MNTDLIYYTRYVYTSYIILDSLKIIRIADVCVCMYDVFKKIQIVVKT